MTLPPFVTALAVRAALWGAVAAAGAVAWQFTPIIGPSAVQRALREDLSEARDISQQWERAALGWQTAFGASERTRADEQKVARAAVETDQQACNVRVAEARRSSAAIRTIITKEPRYDAKGCPVRAMSRADELRDALQGSAR
jgi:hypothetical protein